MSADSDFDGLVSPRKKKKTLQQKSSKSTENKPSLRSDIDRAGKFLYLPKQQIKELDLEIKILDAKEGILINRSQLVEELIDMWLAIRSGTDKYAAIDELLDKVNSYLSQ
jgi:hypothetical protein